MERRRGSAEVASLVAEVAKAPVDRGIRDDGRTLPQMTVIVEEALVFRQYQLACLSLFSYLVGDTTTGRAVVVDPQRDIEQYLADAEAHGLTIERVIETHFHADFLSGHLELAAATGATISYGDRAQADFAFDGLADGQRLSLGTVELEVLHTPGHTPESISLVVRPEPGAEPWAVLTGDALFIGDVGRPDLLSSVGHTANGLARDLYRSLHDKLLTLPDPTLVYPAHGAGSACGKHMSTAVSSSIGEQRTTNYALAPMSEAAFVEAVTEGQSVAPRYFSYAADANRRQRDLLREDAPPEERTVERVLELIDEGAVILDTRAPEEFASGHVRGSINVGLGGRFAEYAGSVVRVGQPLIVTGDSDTALEAKIRLGRIGVDTVVGALAEVPRVLADHPDLAEPSRRLPAHEVAAWIDDEPDLQIIDVRGVGEVDATGMIEGARNIPLPRLLDELDTLDKTPTTIVYCASGYRSSIAASLLQANGFAQVADLLGGHDAWAAAHATT